MYKKMKYINWDTRIFAGFYDSFLYNSDMLYNLTTESENLTDKEYYDFYDDEQGVYTFEKYQQAVAKACCNALMDNINQLKQGNDEIIKNIEFVALHCPRFYNFETDKLEMSVLIDWDKLVEWTKDNTFEFSKYLQDNFTSYDGFLSFVPNNTNDFWDLLQDDFERLSDVLIEFYILQNLDFDSYEQDCIEIASDLIWDYVKITSDEQ